MQTPKRRIHFVLCDFFKENKKRVQEAGLEPAQSCDHRHLKPARLPIPPFLHFVNRLTSLCLAPFVDCSLIITQELKNVNRKIQKN